MVVGCFVQSNGILLFNGVYISRDQGKDGSQLKTAMGGRMAYLLSSE